MKITKLKPNKTNPRLIKSAKFKSLVNSIKDFPEMLDLRPIVVDEKMTILGGNMRYKACLEAGLTEVPVKVAKGLTEAQKKEFIIKDNVGFGEWDWDLLANDWSNKQIEEWGLDVWQDNESFDNIETSDMFELPYGDKEPFQQMTFTLADAQAEAIKDALTLAKPKISETFGNENSNGNALYLIISEWVEQKK